MKLQQLFHYSAEIPQFCRVLFYIKNFFSNKNSLGFLFYSTSDGLWLNVVLVGLVREHRY